MTQRNIVHIEIPTKNGKASGEFYQQLFGWQIVHDDQLNYTMWDPHNGPGGGFTPLDAGQDSGEIIIYVNSNDIEADLQQVVALGGSVIQDQMEIPNTGWFAVFKDPFGGTVALFKSMNPNP